jgi:hypothetical protein
MLISSRNKYLTKFMRHLQMSAVHYRRTGAGLLEQLPLNKGPPSKAPSVLDKMYAFRYVAYGSAGSERIPTPPVVAGLDPAIHRPAGQARA